MLEKSCHGQTLAYFAPLLPTEIKSLKTLTPKASEGETGCEVFNKVVMVEEQKVLEENSLPGVMVIKNSSPLMVRQNSSKCWSLACLRSLAYCFLVRKVAGMPS